MTRMIAVNEKNDIYIGSDGRLVIAENLQGVLQAAQHAAQAQYGEMILAIDQGVPNFQTIWESQANVAQFEAFLRRAILLVPGVTEIRDLDIVVSENALKYEATIITIYGSGVLNG